MKLRIKFWLAILLILPALCLGTELQVNISGTSPEITKAIRADLHLQQATTEPKLTEARIKNLYQLAAEQITTTLQAKGYYNSTITSELVQKDKWIATFVITPGPPTKISSVSIIIEGSGEYNKKLKTALITPKLIRGHTITHSDYEDTKDELLSNSNALGYLQAEFSENIIEVNRSNNTANIKFTINTGTQYVFGKVKFIDGIYPEEFLARFAPFKTGDPYELQKLIEFQANLESADLFSKIRFDPLTDLNDPQNITVPVDVRLTLKPKNRYSGSVGYGTDTGFRGSLGWLHRRTSTEGHKISANITASQVRSTARINYIIPGARPATDRYILGILGQEEDYDELYSRKAELSGQKVMKRGKLESLYGLWYFTETFRIVHGDPTLNKKYLLPTVRWMWVNIKPSDIYEIGTSADLRIRGGVQGILSDNSVAEIEANAKQIFGVTDKMRLLFRTNLGMVASKQFDVLPPSLRFFTGGDESVRGYRYNSLGPLSDPGDPDSNTGGRYLFVGSAELEHQLYQDVSGVVFFDAGNAALSMKIPLAFGSGVGVRYKTPIGKFRVDLAKPLNTVVNKHWRVHVNFGADL
jgi:translocation and assembly module TamA